MNYIVAILTVGLLACIAYKLIVMLAHRREQNRSAKYVAYRLHTLTFYDRGSLPYRDRF